jgi:arylsulfatase
MWEFGGPIARIPDFCAPALGNKNNLVAIEASVGENASGSCTSSVAPVAA